MRARVCEQGNNGGCPKNIKGAGAAKLTRDKIPVQVEISKKSETANYENGFDGNFILTIIRSIAQPNANKVSIGEISRNTKVFGVKLKTTLAPVKITMHNKTIGVCLQKSLADELVKVLLSLPPSTYSNAEHNLLTGSIVRQPVRTRKVLRISSGLSGSTEGGLCY